MVLISTLLLSAPSTFAQSRLYSFFPFALQRGQAVKVTFNGDRLQGAYPLISYTPGLTHQQWEISEDGKKATTSVTIPPDFPLGWHALRLCTPNGITDFRTFYVSDAGLIKETNQPHGFDNPQKIEHETLLEGRLLRNNSLDCYAIELEKGDLLSAEVQALRAGRSMIDLALAVIAPDGTTVAASDDTNITQQDPYVRLVAAQAGAYRLMVREMRHEGNGNAWYLLHTGKFPRPAIARPIGGQPGSELQVSWLNADGSSFEQTVKLPAAATDAFAVFPKDEHGVAPSPVLFRVNDLPVVAEVEPNDGPKAPHDIEIPVALHGTIEKPRDIDHYRFSGKQGQVVQARVYARRPGRSPLDAIMTLKHANNKFLASNDDTNGMPDSMVRFTLPADDQYVIMVRDQRFRGGADFAYRLEVDAPRPRFTLGVPDVARNQSAVLTVCRGNRMAALVTVDRKDVAGAVRFEFPELPEAMSADCQELPAARYRIPLLLSAVADATEGGHLLAIQGAIDKPTQPVGGQLKLRQLLVAGRNNREMWGMTVERLATAIVPPAPVTIELAVPQVPLVRSGTMDLRIVAHRQDGFTAPIKLRMLYNPSGVSAVGSATIAENQNETTLTVTANAKAGVAEWPIVIVGETQHDQRRYQFSTQICPLSIAEQLFELSFPQANIERGTESTYTLGVKYKHEFSERATAHLVGLPTGVTTEPIEFSHGDASLEFKIAAADDARIGRHDGVTCRVTIVRNEEPITHVLGRGRLRVDKPLDDKLTALE